MRTIMKTLGLVGLLGCGSAEKTPLSEGSPNQKTEQVYTRESDNVETVSKVANEVACGSNEKVEYLTSQIPTHFREVRPDTYLIENVPKAKNGYTLGGQLTVYVSEYGLSIFDRTNTDPSKWYNVTNWDSKNKSCAEFGIHLTGKPANYLSPAESQAKFDAFVDKVGKMVKTK